MSGVAVADDTQAREVAQRWTLLVVCVGTALLLINVAGPNVALPAIAAGLGASFEDLQWVLSAYALCLATFQLTAGSLADLLGRRKVFLVGLAAFTVTSGLCALAPSSLALIVARGLQGVAAAIVFPSALAILAQEFQGAARGRAIGVWSATIGLAFAAGPLAAGLLVDLVSWRAMFGLSVVLGVPALLLALRHIGESRDPEAPPVDWRGVTLLSLGLLAVVFALLRGNALGWTSPVVLGLVALGLALLAAFVAVELRERHPMLDPRLFANRSFSGASLVVAIVGGAVFGAFVYLSLYLLVVRGGSPVVVGLQLAPLAIASFAVSLVAQRVAARVPLGAAIAAGMVVSVLGLLLMRGLSPSTPWLALLAGLVVAGVGLGLVNPLVTITHLSTLPPAQGGLASGVSNTARQIGVALGIAGLGALFQGRLTGLVEDADALAAAGPRREAVLAAYERGDATGALAAAPERARPALQAAYEGAFSTSLDELLLVSAGLGLLAALAAALLVRNRDLHPAAAPATA